jgi:YVTN family beta-propeller protein
MNRKLLVGTITCLLTLLISGFAQQPAQKPSPEPERRFDDPADEEDLNRELWEFAKKTPFDSILPYVRESQKQSKAREVAEVELPNGWRIAPAGAQVEVGRMPYEAVMFAGKLVVLNAGYYYLPGNEPHDVSIVDVASATVEKTIKPRSLFPSAVVGPGADLYISGGFDQKVFRIDRQFNIVREYPVNGFTGGVAAIDAERIAVGYLAVKNEKNAYANGRIAILNTTSGKIEKEVDLGYFPYAVRFVSGKLFVTLLGENKLLVLDSNLKLLKTTSVGRTPQEMCTDARQVYVVNTGSDSLSVFDARTLRLNSTISVAAPGSQFGTTPSSCAVDATQIYVTLAGTNAVAIINRRTLKQTALVPTGWYPTKVLIDRNQLVIASAKGIRPRRPNPDGPQPTGQSRVPGYVLNLLKGTVAVVPLSEAQRNAVTWTRQVNSSSPIFDTKRGFNLPIKYVFYIIKENRTYDQILGDLGRGNGDPKLTLFGESVTPVHHQLAREFVTLDNFFVNGEISVLGHAFTTSGYASPFLQWLGNLRYSQRWVGYPFGTVPATMSPVYLWDLLDDKGVDYRIYGENYFLFTRAYRIFTELYGADSEIARRFYDKTIDAARGEDRGKEFNNLTQPYIGRVNSSADAYALLGDKAFAAALSKFLTGDDTFARMVESDDRLRRRFAEYLSRYSWSFRSWDLRVSDLERVREWKKEFEAHVKQGKVPRLSYIWLPNDHTDGASTRILDAFQFMAQNDAALGHMIEVISHSSIWKESLILVVEDDAQNGPDHVDATRTVAFAVSPFVKRDAVVSDRYDQLSMLRTMELILGLKSLNSAEQMAAPMFGIFTDKPDHRPFVVKTVSDKLVEPDRQRYRDLTARPR